ncbi:DUF6438 domain-containing protein [Sphingomonas sp. R86521]|uniref:DUF6438 domain-containing protein n=1 Tax=Sphingomonas sp. R86521 TaxID=3093860 RepID=UPI0036D3D3B8
MTLMLGACVSAPTVSTPLASSPAPSETITISVGPCFGFCPVYTASFASDGTARFFGQRHTAVLGERAKDAGAEAYRELARDLAVFQPATGAEAAIECTAAISDTSEYTVTWTGANGRKTVATVPSGCPGGPGNTLVRILRDVPKRLGIEDWTKQTTRPGESRG